MEGAYYIVDLEKGVYSPIANYGTGDTTFETKVAYAVRKADGVKFAIANENKEIISVIKPSAETLQNILQHKLNDIIERENAIKEKEAELSKPKQEIKEVIEQKEVTESIKEVKVKSKEKK